MRDTPLPFGKSEIALQWKDGEYQPPPPHVQTVGAVLLAVGALSGVGTAFVKWPPLGGKTAMAAAIVLLLLVVSSGVGAGVREEAADVWVWDWDGNDAVNVTADGWVVPVTLGERSDCLLDDALVGRQEYRCMTRGETWPGSPMRVTVKADDVVVDAPEGVRVKVVETTVGLDRMYWEPGASSMNMDAFWFLLARHVLVVVFVGLALDAFVVWRSQRRKER